MLKLDNDAIKESGVTVITLPDTEFQRWQKLGRAHWDKVATMSPEAAQLVKIIKDYYKVK